MYSRCMNSFKRIDYQLNTSQALISFIFFLNVSKFLQGELLMLLLKERLALVYRQLEKKKDGNKIHQHFLTLFH